MINLFLISIKHNRIGPDSKTNRLPLVIVLLLCPRQLLCIAINFSQNKILILPKICKASFHFFDESGILEKTFKPRVIPNPKAATVLGVGIIHIAKGEIKIPQRAHLDFFPWHNIDEHTGPRLRVLVLSNLVNQIPIDEAI